MNNKYPPMTHVTPEGEDYLPRGFRDVDSAAVDKIARCLTFMDSLPQFQQYKTWILEGMHLSSGSIVADLGCGLGFDVRRLSTLVGPEGRAIGVDSSMALIESARTASNGFSAVELVQADIHHLPFADGLLHACKVDRTLQHVERPAAVISEIFRTVGPGGSVVCADPDWGTFVIDDANHAVGRQIAEFWLQDFRNPRMGLEIRTHLEETGFADIRVQEVRLSTSSFASADIVFDIAQSASRLAAATGSSEPLGWLSQLKERDRVNPVCCSVTLLINFATRP
jgi:ubiquinone/menaquinone biosynthesis C-methylase UbiE